MESQFLKFNYVRSLIIGSVTARRGPRGNFLIGTIQFNGAFYSCALFPDSKQPGKMNISVELPVYDTYNYKKDYIATREANEAKGAEIAQADLEKIDSEEEPDGIHDAPPAEDMGDLFK